MNPDDYPDVTDPDEPTLPDGWQCAPTNDEGF